MVTLILKKSIITTILSSWLLMGCVPSIFGISPTVPFVVTPTRHPIESPIMIGTESNVTPIPIATYSEQLRGNLGLDDRCPHFCWLGINPGVTTAEEALALFKASKEVNQETISETESEIRLDWKNNAVQVTIEKGIIKEIILGVQDYGFVMWKFIFFLGKPDETSVRVSQTPDCALVQYDVYFSSHKSAITIPFGSWDGPNQNDAVWTLTLNTEFDLKDRQPWLGYQHLQDYLPGQKLPTGPCKP